MMYPGESQVGNNCVFASVSAALNALTKKKVWDQHSLKAVWSNKNPGQVTPNFRQLTPFVGNDIDHSDIWDDKLALPDFVTRLTEWVQDKDGIAIISLETGDLKTHMPTGNWHMLSLLVHSNLTFVAWNTLPGTFLFVPQSQLLTHVPDNAASRVLLPHKFRDALLLRRK